MQTSIIQEDGKILLIGNRVRDQHANLRQGLLVRYNQDGSLDRTFMSEGKFDLKILNNTDIIHVSPSENGYDLFFTGIEEENLLDRPTDFSKLFMMELVTAFSTSSHELGSGGASKLFPNPVLDHATIIYQLDEKSDVQIQLFDINGRLIETLLDKNELVGEYEKKINVSYLAEGVYIISLITNQRRGIMKFIKNE